jgi:predicted lactoylglutathione lyase
MKQTFINLPIRNVAATDAFFRALGMEKNEQFSSGDTTNAKINDTTFVMLLEDDRFASFVGARPEPVNNNLTIALQFDSPEEIDTFHAKALGAGATDVTKEDPASASFLYGKSFRDINGHFWELFTFIGDMPTA